LREARVALADAGVDDDSYYDVEVDALRRLGRLDEAAEALDRARARAKTPEQSVHVRALEAGLAAASGQVDAVHGLTDALSADPTRRIAAGLRLAALEYVLDAIPDDPRFVPVVERAAPLLADAIAVRIGEVARFDSLVYPVARAAAGDLPLVRRPADPCGRRSLQPWLAAREAVAASDRVAGLLRLDGRRVVACDACGRVATRRQGWLPIGSLLPHLDADVSRVPACTTCAPNADSAVH
jgi:hypothetical protein